MTTTIDATTKFSPKHFAQICDVSLQYAYLIFAHPAKCSYFRWVKYLARCVDAQAIAMPDAQALLRRAYHAHAQRDTSPTALTLALECCK